MCARRRLVEGEAARGSFSRSGHERRLAVASRARSRAVRALSLNHIASQIYIDTDIRPCVYIDLLYLHTDTHRITSISIFYGSRRRRRDSR